MDKRHCNREGGLILGMFLITIMTVACTSETPATPFSQGTLTDVSAAGAQGGVAEGDRACPNCPAEGSDAIRTCRIGGWVCSSEADCSLASEQGPTLLATIVEMKSYLQPLEGEVHDPFDLYHVLRDSDRYAPDYTVMTVRVDEELWRSSSLHAGDRVSIVFAGAETPHLPVYDMFRERFPDVELNQDEPDKTPPEAWEYLHKLERQDLKVGPRHILPSLDFEVGEQVLVGWAYDFTTNPLPDGAERLGADQWVYGGGYGGVWFAEGIASVLPLTPMPDDPDDIRIQTLGCKELNSQQEEWPQWFQARELFQQLRERGFRSVCRRDPQPDAYIIHADAM